MNRIRAYVALGSDQLNLLIRLARDAGESELELYLMHALSEIED